MISKIDCITFYNEMHLYKYFQVFTMKDIAIHQHEKKYNLISWK